MITSQNGADCVDGVSLREIAERFGTPTYVYSANHFLSQLEKLTDGLAPVDAGVRYAVKANSNLAVLKLFAEAGTGFDIVSGGELERVRRAGGDTSRTVFSGVGKRVDEIDFALKVGIECFNVESSEELDRLSQRAAAFGQPAPISIRVNPDVDAATHPYISTGLKENKFGVPMASAPELYRRAHRDPNLSVQGIDCHIGSQIAEVGPLIEAAEHVFSLTDSLAREGIAMSHVDLGGGFGVRYGNEAEFDVAAYGRALAKCRGKRALQILVEPGRFLVASGGLLLCRVEYVKPSEEDDGISFAVVDGSMSDLIRPALYGAHHDVVAVDETQTTTAQSRQWDIVGPVCESGDFLAKQRVLALEGGQLVAVMSAGAYGIGLASNYNSRPRPAEVMVASGEARLIRRREALSQLFADELID
ncbi:MAG: diaminopimelate decarboxylase [Pseudomonadaceae bacterium]|nr:diaminopimelate decarboxylase [Pseudomonadaceae bacterium]